MNYSEYKEKMFQFFRSGIPYSADALEIEDFYCFIDELEEIAKKDALFYQLVADCYSQMNNKEKACEAFQKCYDPANKKHKKKLNALNSMDHKPVPRPGKKATVVPDFPYVAPEIVSRMFVIQPEKKCCICKKEAPAFYTGHAYIQQDEGEKYINFLFDEEKFCADCLKNGTAAKQLNITFQHPYIDNLPKISQKKKETLLRNTPSCSADFIKYYEDLWPTCCEDFCCYHGQTGYTTFTFECIHCGKKFDISSVPESPYEDFE